MKKIVYKTSGTCSQFIEVTADDHLVVRDVKFIGGCDGNTKGISALVKGMTIKDVKARLKGIRCGQKATSCPDQLCHALDELQKQFE